MAACDALKPWSARLLNCSTISSDQIGIVYYPLVKKLLLSCTFRLKNLAGAILPAEKTRVGKDFGVQVISRFVKNFMHGIVVSLVHFAIPYLPIQKDLQLLAAINQEPDLLVLIGNRDLG